jgi:predicted transcriptional regulator
MVHLFRTGEATDEQVRSRAAFHAGAARRLYEAVVAAPGLGVADASRAVGVHRTTLHYHARRLEEAGFLRIDRAAPGVRMFAVR